MRCRARVVLLGFLALAVLSMGCAEPTDGDADRVFQQGGDGPVPDADPDPAGQTPSPLAGANVSLHVVDVGQGDGIVVHLPGFTAVYDTGRWHDDSETAVRDHLEAEDADPDALVISHPDADHAGGCDEVLAAFTVEAIYHPGTTKDTQTWQDCQQAMQAEDAPVFTDADLSVGQRLDWADNARVQILHVDGDASDANAGSLVLEITYGDVALALTGDMTCEVEDRILDHRLVDDLDVVQVAHHGSATSTCSAWLDATDPEAGFVSVGADNRYGHPHDEVLDRLDRYGVDVYRTDEHGDIEVTTDGTDWDAQTATGTAAANDDNGSSTEPSDTTTAGPVAIDHVRYDADGNDNRNMTDEWVRLTHAGNVTVSLEGWQLADGAGHTYTIPANTTMSPGATVTVHTGSGEDTAEHLYWGRSQAVWNNDGDTATLRDAGGELVDRYVY